MTKSNEKKIFWSQHISNIILSLIALLIGLCNGWSSPYLAKLSTSECVDGIPKLNDEELSWLASLINVGRILGTIIGAISQDIIGRKWTLYLSGAPMLGGWICVSVATNLHWLYASRVLCGLSMGVVLMTLPHYVSEIADPEIRGSLVMWNIATNSIGMFIGNLIGPYISMKIFAYISIAINILFLTSFLFIPDSPYWHIMQGDPSRAEKSLKWFRRKREVKKELTEIQGFVGNSSKISLGEKWNEFKQRKCLKNFLLMFLISAFLYFCDFGVISNYTEIIMKNSKVNIKPSTIVSISGFCSIISGLLATLLVDKFGRRFLLITSSTGVALSFTFLGLHFQLLKLDYDPMSLSWLPCTCLILYMVAFSSGLGCVPSALVGELFSPGLKSMASLSFTGFSALFSFASSATFLSISNAIGDNYLFWLYALGIYVSVIYYYFCLTETKGKSLKDIQADAKVEIKE